MDNKAESLVESVSTLLRLFILDETRFPSAEGKMRYNPIDFQTIRFIDKNPGSKGADVARALGVAPTTQQSALDRLIKKDLVVRQAHNSNRRARAYSLTNEGTKLRAAILRQDLSNMKSILDSLSDAEQSQLVKILHKVARHLD